MSLGRTLGHITLKRGREGDHQGVSYHRSSGAREVIFGVSLSSSVKCGNYVPTFVLGGKKFSFWTTSERRGMGGVWARTVKR